jgi:hypothetical protein|uniref:Uncharacterized protein n=1 Tax=Populus trichocarpa TaxID=3694 RepID=A0A2K1Z8X0_POPTR
MLWCQEINHEFDNDYYGSHRAVYTQMREYSDMPCWTTLTLLSILAPPPYLRKKSAGFKERLLNNLTLIIKSWSVTNVSGNY